MCVILLHGSSVDYVTMRDAESNCSADDDTPQKNVRGTKRFVPDEVCIHIARLLYLLLH